MSSPFTRLCQAVAEANQSVFADLHTHTTASDGRLTPGELVSRAAFMRLGALAITDHDTTRGYELALKVLPQGLDLHAGVEITCRFNGRDVHLLGYFFDPFHPGLRSMLESNRGQRRERFHFRAQLLADKGKPIDISSYDDPLKSLGRPHLAEQLVKQGYINAQQQAFQGMLDPPPGVRLPPVGPEMAEAVRLLHEAGGIASLAHPADYWEPEEYKAMRDFGLDALECDYSWTNANRKTVLRRMAVEFGMRVTGGSDYHGDTIGLRMLAKRGLTRAGWAELRA